MSPHSLLDRDRATSAWRRSPSGNGRPNSSIRRREDPPLSVIVTMAQTRVAFFLIPERMVNEPVPPPTVTTRSVIFVRMPPCSCSSGLMCRSSDCYLSSADAHRNYMRQCIGIRTELNGHGAYHIPMETVFFILGRC